MSWEEYKYYFVRCYQKQKFDQLGCCGPVLVVLAVVFILASCRTEYFPVETVREIHHNHTDSFFRTDSFISETKTVIKEADSATIAELGLQLRQNERAILILKNELQKIISQQLQQSKDTVIQRDSIQVPVPVERKLSKWETFCIDYGKVMVGTTATVLLFLIFLIARWISGHRRKA